MPNPFSKKTHDDAIAGMVEIKNSTLICEKCFEETSEGSFFPSRKLLVFTCPNGHHNEVRNIEL